MIISQKILKSSQNAQTNRAIPSVHEIAYACLSQAFSLWIYILYKSLQALSFAWAQNNSAMIANPCASGECPVMAKADHSRHPQDFR